MHPVDIGSVEVENLIMEFANLLCCCYLSMSPIFSITTGCTRFVSIAIIENNGG
jgi:hypothetical protein